MININRVLKKKGWTGKDLGRLQIANAALTYDKSLKADDPQIKPIISKADLLKMVSSIKDPTEIETYNGYIDIYSWVCNTSPMAIAQEQQAQLCLNNLYSHVENAVISEDIYEYIEKLPLIMTEKQYKETVERRTQEILHPDGKDLAHNVLQLVFNAINYYVDLLEKHPKAKNPLKPLKKELEKELVEDPHILDNYNRIMELGYYTLEDGTRSDRVSPIEWGKLVTSKVFKLIDQDNQIGIKKGYLIKQCILRREPIKANLELYGEEDPKEAEERTFLKACRWNYYEDSPEGFLTKWQVLNEGHIEEYYPYFEDEVTDDEAQTLCQAFCSEFPTVVKALLEDMGNKYPKLANFKDLPIEKWLSTVCSWDDLYKADFYGFRETEVGDLVIFKDRKRALLNGVAILKNREGEEKPLGVDSKGYYKMPDIKQSLLALSLEGYFPESEEYSDHIDLVEDDRQTLLSSMYFVQGFNKALDLIASMYNVDEIKLFKRPQEKMIKRVKVLNQTIYFFYKQIKDIDYEDPNLKEKKLEVLRNILYPIDLNALTIPKEDLEQAVQNMKDFKGFQEDSLDPYKWLCLYKPVKEETTGKDLEWLEDIDMYEGEGLCKKIPTSKY